MAEVEAFEIRTVVVVGKTGAGKSTVANQILGREAFKVKNVASSVTSEVEDMCSLVYDESSNTRYNFRVIDTLGVFDTSLKNDAVITKIKKFFQNEAPGGVNLVLFVFRKGRFTKEERETFDYIIKHFKKEISNYSALVLTNCDGQSDAANQQFRQSFEDEANDIADFMKKGIYMVGFPDLSNMRPLIKEAMEVDIKEHAKMLQKEVMKASKKCLGKEMFEETFWEKLWHCFIL